MLILHVIIACSSLIYTGYLFLRPSKSKLQISYGLLAATIATGSFLVITKPASMVPACEAGLIYLGVVLSGIFSARHRLAQSI